VDIKFHLDEHIDSAVATGLRLRGVDVTTTIEQGLDGTSDSRQLAFAHAQGRVLVTCDSDFIVLARSGVPHAGIVFWPARHRRLGQVVLDLVLLSRVVNAEEMAGHVEFL
jgi:uncharacterized protein with PIN domain